MKILIAGSNGMIGSALTRYVAECGHEVFRLVRHIPGPQEVWWDPDHNQIDARCLEGFDGVVHLASRPWPMRWTAKAKNMIRLNRVGTNRLLAQSLAECAHKPQCSSALPAWDVTPPSGDTILTEDSPVGTSFLAKVDLEGEDVTSPASEAGIRVVHLRIPPVLGGAALKRLGMFGGDGRQWMSWVGRDELASIIEFILRTESLTGPVNPASPNPMRGAEFAATALAGPGTKTGWLHARLPGAPADG